MQTTDNTPAEAQSSNVIAFPMDRVRLPAQRPLWASCGLYDLEMMEAYWRDMAEQFD